MAEFAKFSKWPRLVYSGEWGVHGSWYIPTNKVNVQRLLILINLDRHYPRTRWFHVGAQMNTAANHIRTGSLMTLANNAHGLLCGYPITHFTPSRKRVISGHRGETHAHSPVRKRFPSASILLHFTQGADRPALLTLYWSYPKPDRSQTRYRS